MHQASRLLAGSGTVARWLAAWQPESARHAYGRAHGLTGGCVALVLALLLCVPQLAHAVPTDIQLSNQSVGIGGGFNATVGTFSTSDAGVGETFTYTLVTGAGDTDNPAFQISGNSLLANNPSTFTPGTQKSVRVRSTNSQNATYEKAFTISVMSLPVIQSVAPNAGPTGGGMTVSIVGSGFAAANLTGAVKFGASTAGYVINSDTSINATSPANAAGTYDITVTTPNGTSTTHFGDQYTYVPAPTVTAVSSTAGPTVGGDTVILTGTGFSAAPATGAVQFGGATAIYIINSNTQITAIAPANAPGTYNIRVSTPGGASAPATANMYTYVAAPTVTTVSPASGPSVGGTTVTIIGSGFAAAPGTGAVWFGGAAASYTINSNTQITATAPANLVGNYHVTVTTPGGTSATSGANQYSYLDVPVASSFTSAAVTYNASGVPLSLAGHATHAPTNYAVGSTTTAQGGSVAVDPAGLVMYFAPIGFRGNDSFTFTATNSSGTSAPATVTVPVSNPVLSSTLIGNGTRGVALSGVQISTSGGRAPYNCSNLLATGALPAGTQLNTDCTISGTPAASGTFNFTATVTDSTLGIGPFSQTTGALSLTIAAPVLSLSPASGALPGGAAGVAYSQTFTANGGTTPYVYARTSGAVPPGLTLADGTLSGTPTVAGTYNFDITVTDASSAGSGGPYSRVQSYSVSVAQGSQTITFNALPNVSLSASPLALSATASSGLTVGFTSITMGVCSVVGTSVTLLQPGTCSIIASQDGDAGWAPAADVVRSFTVTPANLVLNAGAASAPRVGDNYSQSNVATGGAAPYTYALNAGALVPGTSLNMSTGLVSGTPTVAGSFAYQLRVTDSQAPSAIAVGAIVSVTIAKGNQTVGFMPSLPSLVQVGGAPYSVTAVASSGLTPTVSLAAGSSGCVLAGGTLTFTAVGTCMINANQAGDSNWNAAAQAQHSINIGAAGGIAAAVDFSPGQIGVGAAGQVTITFTNPNASSSPAFSVLLTSPVLVSRIPAVPVGSCLVGSASVPSMNTVQLTNVVVPAGSCTVTFGYNGTTAGSAMGFVLGAFTPSGYPTTQSTIGNSFAVVPTVSTISPNAGPASQVVTISGTGFSTTPGNNLVSFGGAGNGTVTAASATSLTVTTPAAGSGPVAVTVAVNGQASTSNATYTFIDKPVAADTTGVTVPYNSTGTAIDLSGAITGTHHSIAIGSAAAHGTTSVAGDVVTYTPTAGYFGTDSFTFTATGTGGTSNIATVSLTVATPAAPVAADRAVMVPYQSPGTPIDLASSITGVHAAIAISTAPQHGTASIAGDVVSYVPAPGYSGPDTFTYVATGPGGTSAPARVSLTVSVPPLELGPTSLAAATASNAYTQRVTASGGTAPYTYAASTLPTGLVLSADGELSGVPTGAGSFGFDITVTDSSTGAGPFSVTRHYTLVVAAPSLQLDPALPPATADVGYQQQLGASGGTRPYRFSLSSGALPPGLTLLESGRIEGEPSAAGNYDFSVQVTDANGFTGVQAYHFQVQAGAQVISAFVATPAEPVYVQGGSFTLGANGGGSGNPVSFASSTPAVCTVSGTTVTMLAAGTCGLTADQAGNAMYQAATQVRLDVNIAVGTPQLSWLGDLTRTQGEDAFELPAPHSSSPGAFSYASSNPAVATISGRTVTLVGEGTTVLVATQAATSNFAAATVQLQLTVNARPDPTHDGQVSGGLQAQVDASVRFAQVQGDNIRARLRQVRSGTNASNFNFALAYAGSQQSSGLTLPVGQAAEAALPALPQGWGLWLAGTATFGKVGRNGRAGGGFDFDTGGITLGADRAVGENLLFGMAGSWGRQGTDFDGSPSKADADQRSLAAYGLWRLGEHLFVDGLLANGRLDFDLTRWSEPANASAQASRKGDQWFGSLTVGYEHRHANGMSVTGYGRYDGHRATLDGYREHGLGIYDLDYGRQRVDNSALAVGLEGSLSFKRERLNWRPYWSIEYRSALENRGDVAMNYVQRPQGSDYVLAMRSYNDDMLALGAGMDLQLDSGWMFSLLLGHEQGRNAMRSNSIGLQVRFGQQGASVPMFGEGDELGVGDGARRRCHGDAATCTASGSGSGTPLP